MTKFFAKCVIGVKHCTYSVFKESTLGEMLNIVSLLTAL